MGIGRGNAYIIDRLQREDPKLAEQIHAGQISPYRASLLKGWRKPQAPLAQLIRWWRKATVEERLSFQDHINE